jgi:hypothetical protein
MAEDAAGRLGQARTAAGDSLKQFLHSDEATLLALLENPALDESHLATLLKRLDLPGTVLAGIASRAEWTATEAVRVGLVRHPKTPRRAALTLLRQLYLFDLVKVALAPSTPA